MKNRMPIIAAVILGIFVVFAIQSYLKKESDKVQSQLKQERVLVVGQNLAKGTELTEAMLKWRKVPSQAMHHKAMTKEDERRQIVGRTIRTAIPRGELILWTDLEIEKRGGLSSLIPEGERAFSVEFGETSLLQLNDRVDIIGIFNEPKTDAPGPVGGPSGVQFADQNSTVCIVLLQNVNVIAIGSTIGEVYQAPGINQGSTLTFSLTLPEAQLLMYATTHGELAIVLRRDGDVEVIARENLPRITMQELEKITGQLDEERFHRTIRIMKGGKIEEIEVESPEGVDTFEE